MANSRPPFQFGMRALLGAVAAVAVGICIWDNTVDPGGKALGVFFGHRTVYAEGYSDRGWNAVHVGMSKEKVLKILGEPLAQFTRRNRDYCAYSGWEPDRKGNYHRRDVTFEDGHVSEKITEFCID